VLVDLCPSFANHRGFKSSGGLSALVHDAERRFRQLDCIAAAAPGARKNGNSILVEAIAGHIVIPHSVMPQVKLTRDEIAALSAYIFSLRGNTP
jgi:hypothetical protein